MFSRFSDGVGYSAKVSGKKKQCTNQFPEITDFTAANSPPITRYVFEANNPRYGGKR
jgi:hypothetical protein